jgi:YihY family inner membrane protein
VRATKGRLVERIDAWQQRRPAVSFLVATFVRYREDRGRQYGALLSYYGFISLFPLLLVAVTVIDIVLADHADLRRRILDTIYARVPVVGAQLRVNPTSVHGSGVALAFGIVVSLWAGLAVAKHAEDALNLQWGVPRFRHPRFLERNLRALGVLAVIGTGVLIATAATNLAAFVPDLVGEGRVFATLLAIVINVLVLTASFRVLIRSKVAWRALIVGGACGGIVLWLLQLIGGEYVSRVIVDASDVYGAFAVMFGLLAWIALLSRVTLLASEINVVRAKQLWPRSAFGLDSTEADRRAAAEAMAREALFDASSTSGGT